MNRIARQGCFLVVMALLLGNLHMARAEKNAGLAMLLCIIPGGGQFYTERYVPGVIIGAAEVAIGYYAYRYHTDEDYARRNSMLWWGLFAFGFSLADSYVGAKMHGFDIQADIDKVSLSYRLEF